MSASQSPIEIRPNQLVLRCYVRRSGRTPNRSVAHCVDLDLWAVGASPEAAKKSLEDAISSYLRVVLETKDDESIVPLLRRRAPLRFVLLWHIIRLLDSIRHNGPWPLGTQPFEERLPVRFVAA